MADMHLAQLTFQHNDAVEDEDDARDKYVVRQLFRKLAYDGRLATGFGPQNDDVCESTFRLFSEDLRPSNVLINEDLKVVGVIDWEFAYAAPTHFSFDPPWWLLLESPERWPDGFEDWIEAYKPRLETFLSVLEDEEKSLRAERGVSNGLESLSISSDEGLCLSQQMRRNWEDESWMIRYAARNSWVLDFIFYRYLDPKYFGENKTPITTKGCLFSPSNRVTQWNRLLSSRWSRVRKESWFNGMTRMQRLN